jgi:P27 family predicted phage terminase small subunit
MKTAPKHLQAPGRNLWQKVLAEFDISDGHDLTRLEQACGALDRVEQARRRIRKDGAYLKDRFGQLREHPAHRVEQCNRSLLARLLRELRLDIPQPEDSTRPRPLY